MISTDSDMVITPLQNSRQFICDSMFLYLAVYSVKENEVTVFDKGTSITIGIFNLTVTINNFSYKTGIHISVISGSKPLITCFFFIWFDESMDMFT